jgi:glycosyltransferase involved in cell wall biosynthesis
MVGSGQLFFKRRMLPCAIDDSAYSACSKTANIANYMPLLSVIVITCNEAHNIAACLASVDFADERIVLDSGSTDDTVAIARAAAASVHISPDWPGFGLQKNRALALATGDWVLSIDADERVTEPLRLELQTLLSGQPECGAWSMPRSSSYCGQFMRHGGWYPDRVVRLFRRGEAQFSDDLVHEKLMTSGPVGQLHADLRHESFVDLESVLDKVNRYSTAGAQAMKLRGKRSSLGKALGHGLWAFVRTYVIKLGFLDGQMGLVLAISNAQGTYYRYLKRWLIDR